MELENERFKILAEQYPELSPRQLKEADENLTNYLALVVEIMDRRRAELNTAEPECALTRDPTARQNPMGVTE